MANGPGDRWQRFNEWLWHQHSAGQATKLCITTTAMWVSMAWCADRLWPHAKLDSSGIATLNTLAQVAGGVFATIVTVVVFAIGLASDRPDGGWAYVPFLSRRFHVFTIAALAASVGLANALAPIPAVLFESGALSYLLWFNVALLGSIVMLGLGLMCRVIESLSGADITAAIPVIRATLRTNARHDEHVEATAVALAALLKDSGLTVNPYAGHFSFTPKDHRFAGRGATLPVVDVDVHALRALLEIIRPYREAVEFALLTAPTLDADVRGALFYAPQRRPSPRVLFESEEPDSPPEQMTLDQLIPRRVQSEIDALSSRLFVFGPPLHSDADSRQFFSRLQAEMVRLAHAGDAVLLKLRLADFRTLVGEWLAITGRRARPHRPQFLMPRAHHFVGPLEIDLGDVVQAATQSEDASTYWEAVDAASYIATDAYRNHAHLLFAETMQILPYAFRLALQSETLRSGAAARFDSRLGSFLSGVKADDEDEDDTGEVADVGEDAATERTMQEMVVSAALLMTRWAVEAGEAVGAIHFIDRILRTSERGLRGRLYDNPPANETSVTRAEYARIVIIGWCIHMVRESHTHSDAARTVLTDLLRSVPPRHYLVRLWELYHGASSLDPRIDHALGCARWDLKADQRRTGITYVSDGGAPWISDGLLLALLASRDAHKYEQEMLDAIAPPIQLWAMADLAERIDGLTLAIPTAVPADDRSNNRDKLVAFIAARQRAADVLTMRTIIQSPLGATRVELLKGDIAKGVVRHRVWLSMLGAKGIKPPATSAPSRVVNTVSLPRDFFLERTHWAGSYGGVIGEHIATREAQALLHGLERALSVELRLNSMLDLPNAVNAARESLVARGFNPDLIVLPPQERFACALFRLPLWGAEVKRNPEWKGVSIGQWDGLDVVRCPYRNTGSIIVAEAAKVFSRSSESPTTPETTVGELPPDQAKALLQRLTGDGPLPKSDEVRVKVVVTLDPPVGFNELGAAYRIDVSSCDGCFAMEPGMEKYHRTGCTSLEGAEHLVFSLVPRMDGEDKDRVPCEVCHPEQWDIESRMSRMHAQSE
jgi:hypothetical protein